MFAQFAHHSRLNDEVRKTVTSAWARVHHNRHAPPHGAKDRPSVVDVADDRPLGDRIRTIVDRYFTSDS
jgi:hypothetical protein